MINKSEQEFDLVIVGAGLVGCSLACALQHTGIKIALLEKKIPAYGEALGRPISLAFGSKQYLEQFGVWPKLAEFSSPIEHVQVSSKGSFGKTHFSAKQENLPALGYVVPFNKLHQALFERAANSEQVSLFEIDNLQLPTSNPQLISIDSQTLNTQCLIAADGTHSKTRELLGVNVHREAHQQIAISARIQLNQPHTFTAYERFSAPGVLALLPIWDRHQVNMVWTMGEAQAQSMLALSDEAFKQAVQQAFGSQLGEFKQVTRQANYPLVTQIATNQVARNAVILGNAAHTIYPIAAQGFNLGLRDVMALAHCLQDAKAQQQSLGDLKMLSRYVALREKDQQQMIDFVTKGEKLFAKPLPKFAKGLALSALDVITPIKHRMALKTTGIFS